MAEGQVLQTSLSDIRAGWRTFRAWSKRFRSAARCSSENLLHSIYLADWSYLEQMELFGCPSNEDVENKIAFMKAYLNAVAMESRDFNVSVKKLLKFQSRFRAPHVLGFWFVQTDIDKFGPGTSLEFQNDRASIFCEDASQIDFADMTAIMPHDLIVVRSPTGRWTKAAIRKLTSYVRRDLAFDGIETAIDVMTSGELVFLKLVSPYYGWGR